MPAPGDQHSSIANPFEEPKGRVYEYTAEEKAALQDRLEKQLGPEYLSSRAGPSGQKVHYIEAVKCIALANEVFGFNGWSSSIQNIQVDFVDEHPQTLKISLGLSVIVRVTLRDGAFHEDIGYGHIENCKTKAAAFEKAKKEGTTDALKRALRNFGNVLGNCIYDKAYLAKVTKLKVAPTKFDVDRLHRHSDFAIKKELAETEVPKAETGNVPLPQLPTSESFEDFLGELDEADFNISEEGHPDEVVLPPSNIGSSNERPQNQNGASNVSMQPPSRGLARSGSAGSNYPRHPQPHTPNQQQAARPISNAFGGAQNNNINNNMTNPGARPQPQQFNQNRHVPQHGNHNPPPQPQPQAVVPIQPTGQPSAMPPPGEVVGFFSARAVTQLPEEALASGHIAPKAGQVFNPRAESPSIRKTPGIDHTKSKPLARNGQHVPPAVTPDTSAGAGGGTAGSGPGLNPGPGVAGGKVVPRPAPPGSSVGRTNVVNPQLDQARRIGAPGASSPLANRGQYRPPTMKRPSVGADVGPAPGGAARLPLADMSNTVPVAGGGGTGGPGGGTSGSDFKRQKLG